MANPSHRPFSPKEDALMLGERAKRPQPPYTQIARMLGRNTTSVTSRIQKLEASIAEERAAMRSASPVIVTNGALRDRETTPCTVPLRTIVIAGRATGLRT